ncbi:hypothetical protein DL767_008894 [Monosporascus sp. MG133]|nr:hypothetical protein DL767_008894 [Monosporascus sp. MG133]
MAEPKLPPASPSLASSRNRPFNTLIALAFWAIAAAALWLMRVEPALNDVPAGFMQQLERGVLEDGSTPLRTRYTGVAGLDAALAGLVAAFVAGPAGFDAGVRAQQMHCQQFADPRMSRAVLISFFAVVAVWAVEASRRRSAGRAMVWTPLFGFLYQTVGGAVVVPLFYVAYVAASRDDDAYHRSGRELRPGYARALLPATVLGYLVPTLAMFAHGYWGRNLHVTQALIAFWQPAPLLVDALLAVFASVLPWFPPSSASSSSLTPVSRASARAPPKNGDVPHLKRLYLVAGLVSVAAHVGTLYACLSSSDPRLSLRHVFVPDRSTWRDGPTPGLHWIFQWDWWGIVASSLLWCWVVVADALRLLHGRENVAASRLVGVAVGIVALALVAGPGTAIAAVWSWREDKLVMIEEGRRPKVA